MRLSKRYDISSGVSDFWSYIRQPTPARWPALAISLLATSTLLWLIVTEEVWSPPERPKVSLISTFAADRSDAEIVASNLANQKRKERLAAEQAARDEQVKDLYRQLGRATGLDVDAMEREIAAEKAAEEAAMKARLEANAKAGARVEPPAR